VAFDADPGTGVAVYVTLPSSRGGTQGTWMTVGGTSLGAPAWAAIIAIADQDRAVAGLGSLDGPTQTLPTLYKLPSSDFHTVTPLLSSGLGGVFGGYGGFGFGPGGYTSWFYGALGSSQQTNTGANTVTGLGSVNGAALIDGLATSTLTVPVATVPGSGGGTGGGITPTPTPTPNPGGPGHHHRRGQTGRTKGQTHKSGSTPVRKPATQSSSSHKATVRHNGAV
jgi:hypothetical protein